MFTKECLYESNISKLTLLQESGISKNNIQIANYIIDNDIDVCLFQEVAQNIDSPIEYENIRINNQLLNISKLINRLSHNNYHFYYDISNYSFNDFEEGLGILTKHKIISSKSTYISKAKDLKTWSSRKVVSCDIEYNGTIIEFCSAHLGWSDGYEIFESQFDKLIEFTKNGPLGIIAGDFNITQNSSAYNYIINKGYHDLFIDGPDKVIKNTYIGEGKDEDSNKRIDYFFSKNSFKVLSNDIIFNKDTVSDHYGIVIEIDDQFITKK